MEPSDRVSERRRRIFRRRGRRALRRMSYLQREIFLALRADGVSYPQLAEQHGISVEEVMEHFTQALLILGRAVDDPGPWWRRLWPW